MTFLLYYSSRLYMGPWGDYPLKAADVLMPIWRRLFRSPGWEQRIKWWRFIGWQFPDGELEIKESKMPILDVTPVELDLLIYELASYLESMFQGTGDLTALNNEEDLFAIPSDSFDDPVEAEKRQVLGMKLLNIKKGR